MAVLGLIDSNQTVDLLGYFVIVNMLTKVINKLPDNISSRYVYNVDRHSLILLLKDLYYAYMLFCCWSCLNKDSRKTKGAKKKKLN
jgi:rRNA processing protein Krr1/Pno1